MPRLAGAGGTSLDGYSQCHEQTQTCVRLSAKPWATKGMRARNGKGGNALHAAVGTGNIDGAADLLQLAEFDISVANFRR